MTSAEPLGAAYLVQKRRCDEEHGGKVAEKVEKAEARIPFLVNSASSATKSALDKLVKHGNTRGVEQKLSDERRKFKCRLTTLGYKQEHIAAALEKFDNSKNLEKWTKSAKKA